MATECSSPAATHTTFTWRCLRSATSAGSSVSDAPRMPSRASPRPHTNTSPSEVQNSVWYAPADAMRTTRYCSARTRTGVYWLSVLPRPSRPNQPPPHANTAPRSVTQIEWLMPSDADATRTDASSPRTMRGRSCAREPRPWPSLPMSPAPHVYSAPFSVMQAEWFSPAATSITLRPDMAVICTGRFSSCLRPVPSWPSLPRPHANMSPPMVQHSVCCAPHATRSTLRPASTLRISSGTMRSRASPCSPRPSCPCSISPHDHREPPWVSTTVCWAPAATNMADLDLASMRTRCASASTSTSDLPMPVCSSEEEAPVTPRPCMSCTGLGSSRCLRSPWPSRPLPPNPQLSTTPSSVMVIVWNMPHATCVTRLLCSPLTTMRGVWMLWWSPTPNRP
mmetsp:Transcript_22257/g.71648  ORF Transcript_22257/g.71648 Transcript_22257/m.71648 type:complete len:394 (-) Transcript_22257:987-2168(-)